MLEINKALLNVLFAIVTFEKFKVELTRLINDIF